MSPRAVSKPARPTAGKRTTKPKPTAAKDTADLTSVLASLKRAGSAKYRDGFARYGIIAEKAYGVPVGAIQKIGKTIGKDHDLAIALWGTGIYDARMLAAFVGEPARVTVAEMNRWCADFDNWAVCDTITFHLFDRTPHAFGRIEAWHMRREEFVKRAAFALLAAVALHDKSLTNAKILSSLPWCEAAATDDRNFVKKGVSWALRTIGVRNRELHAATLALAKRLAGSADVPSRWIGKDVLRDLQRPIVERKLAKRG